MENLDRAVKPTKQENLLQTEARLKFLEAVLPLIRELKTPEYWEFCTVESPDIQVNNIPVSGIWLYGKTSRNKAHAGSDIDLAVTFPFVETHATLAYYFDHQRIGDWLRRDFMTRYALRHDGKPSPYYVDIMPYPDPRYVGKAYFKTRRLWNTIVKTGRLLWQSEDNGYSVRNNILNIKWR